MPAPGYGGRTLPDIDLTPLRPEKFPVPGPRPRLLIKEGRIELLREAAAGRGDEVLVTLVERLITQAGALEKAVKEGAVAEKMMYGEHAPRGWYNILPYLALGYLVTGEDGCREALLKRLGELLEAPVPGLDDDLTAAHLQLSFSVVYDWMEDILDEAVKAALAEYISAEADAYWRSFRLQCDYYHDIYLQNHHHANVMGLAASGTCLRDRAPAAGEWLAEAAEAFRRIACFHPPDGSSCEGPSYAAFGYEAKVLGGKIIEDAAGLDMLSSLPGLKGITLYILAHLIPGFRKDRNVVPAADCSGRLDKHGPAHFLWLIAQKAGDPLAQGVALECVRRGVGADAPLSWLSPLWYEPVEAVPVEDWPLTVYCPDIDIISHRTGWGNRDTAVFFECGPFQGHQAEELTNRDMGGAHVHPDSGCFILVSAGDYLAGDPAGYTTCKLTAHHNCVLVDGRGQLGEGMKWFNVNESLHHGSTAAILSQGFSGGLFHVLGEYTRRYHPRFGLKKAVRLLAFLEPDLLVVYDRLEAAGEHEYTWLYHPGEGVKPELTADGFTVRGEKSILRAVVAAPAGAACSIGSRPVEDKKGRVHRRPEEIALAAAGRAVDFLVVMSMQEEADLFTSSLEAEGARRTILLPGGRRIVVDPGAGTVDGGG